MDSYAKFALSKMSSEQRARVAKANADEQEREEKAKERKLRCLNESYKIDASKISLEDLDQVNGDWNNDKDVAILWALGRYLLQKDRNFTNQEEMDILQKYLDKINPEIHPNEGSYLFPKSKIQEYSNDGFSCLDDQVYRYYDFLQKLNMNDEQLIKVLEQHPCPSPTLFNKRPEIYTKQSAQQVVEQVMRYFTGFDEEFQETKKTYIENFGDDFDTIMVDTDNNKGSVMDIIRQYVIREKYFVPNFEYAPEYIIKCLPELLENFSCENIISRFVTKENKDGLGKLLEKIHKEKLVELQKKVDAFFLEQGNLKYIKYDNNFEYTEIGKDPNIEEVVYECYVPRKYGMNYSVLVNLKHAKEAPENFLSTEQLIIYRAGDISVRYPEKPQLLCDFNERFLCDASGYRSNGSHTTFLNEMLWYGDKKGAVLALNNGASPFTKAGFFRDKFEAMPFNMFFNRELKNGNHMELKEFMEYIASNINEDKKGVIKDIWTSLGGKLRADWQVQTVMYNVDKIIEARFPANNRKKTSGTEERNGQQGVHNPQMVEYYKKER